MGAEQAAPPTAALAGPSWRTTFLTLAVATTGGALAMLPGLPLPWLLGPLIAVAATGRWTAPALPASLVQAAIFVLGLQVGATLTPDSLDRLAALPLMAAGLAVSTALAMAAGYWALRGLAGWDASTALLAATPGALSMVLAMLPETAASASRVTLAQIFRLASLVTLYSLLFHGAAQAAAASAWSLEDGALATGLGFAGWALASRLKAPAAVVLGPALTTGALTAMGAVAGAPPAILFQAALCVVAARTGTQIAAAPFAAWRRDVGAVILAFLAMLAATTLTALAIAPFATAPLPVALLAFAPGGFEAMVAIAAALNLDPALVGAAHVARVLALTLAGPWLFRALAARA